MLRTLQYLLLAYASRQGPAPLTPKWSRENVLVNIQGNDGYTFALGAFAVLRGRYPSPW